MVRRKRRKKKREIAEKITHFLVPKHELVKEDDYTEIFEKYGVMKDQLPRIKNYDPAIRHLEVKNGDIIRIIREENDVKTEYFRVVTE